jgi:hypothetical protein
MLPVGVLLMKMSLDVSSFLLAVPGPGPSERRRTALLNPIAQPDCSTHVAG